jgi:hypothetical protein
MRLKRSQPTVRMNRRLIKWFKIDLTGKGRFLNDGLARTVHSTFNEQSADRRQHHHIYYA